MISREEALIILKKYLINKENLNHSLLVEEIMKDLSKRLNRDETIWGLTGLLHNIDYEYTEETLEERGNLSSKILTGLISEKGINAIKGLNYVYTDYLPVNLIDKSLMATSSLTDLIFKLLNNISKDEISHFNVTLLYEKYKDERFAPRIDRNRIKAISDVGISLENFFKIAINSLSKVYNQLTF